MEGGNITVDVAAALVSSQFPEWSDLPIRPLPLPGWDNVSFRLGEELIIRLPRDDAHAPQVAKEHQWLPVLAPQLPFPIPDPVAIGKKDDAFPRKWSIYRWIEGEPVATAPVDDSIRLARDLARFLNALEELDASQGPPPGSHSFNRGGSLSIFDTQTRATIDQLGFGSSASVLVDVWDASLESAWSRPPAWVHGDVTASNLLTVDGSLSAVIDFGCSAVGDPACDLVMAWTYFPDGARQTFRSELGLDDDTWARGRGWALWKALITLLDDRLGRHDAARAARRFGWQVDVRQVLDRIVDDHRTAGR